MSGFPAHAGNQNVTGLFFLSREKDFVVTFWKPESFICHFPHLCALVRNSRYTTFTNCNGLVLLQQPVKGFAKTATCNTSASRQKWEFPKTTTCLNLSGKLAKKKCHPCFSHICLFRILLLFHRRWINPSSVYAPHSSQKISDVYFFSKIHSIGNLNWVLSDWIQKSVQIQGLLQIWSFMWRI